MEQIKLVMAVLGNNERRTHTLSNGEVIWDVAGNAWEWVKDDSNNEVYGDNCLYVRVDKHQSHSSQKFKWGNDNDPKDSQRSVWPQWGLLGS